MALSMYDVSIPVFIRALTNLSAILDKGAAHAKALKDMVRQARARHAEGRQILIFPEGTRGEIGAAPDYKPGIAALYRDLDAACTPMSRVPTRPRTMCRRKLSP